LQISLKFNHNQFNQSSQFSQFNIHLNLLFTLHLNPLSLRLILLLTPELIPGIRFPLFINPQPLNLSSLSLVFLSFWPLRISLLANSLALTPPAGFE
jgi:hypothetical protein